MTLLNTTYLFGLLGVILPIIIHLWSRKESKIIKIGSIRFMPKSDTSQSSSICLNEVLLLLIRSMLIGLLCFLLAGVLLEDDKEDRSRITLIDPDYATDGRVIRALDTLKGEVRFLSSGFQVFNQNDEPEEADKSLWTLVTAANELPADTLLIFSDLSSNEFKGRRAATNKVIQWINLEPLEPSKYKHRLLGEQYEIIGHSDALFTSYAVTESANETNGEPWDTLAIQLVYDPEFEQDMLLMKSALLAIEKQAYRTMRIHPIRIDDFEMESSDWLIWLSESEIPSFGNKTIYYAAKEFNGLLTETSEGFVLSRRLTSSLILEEDMLGRLFEILIPEKPDNKDIRQMPLELVKPIQYAEKTTDVTNKAEAHWLWILFGLLLILERYFSLKRSL